MNSKLMGMLYACLILSLSAISASGQTLNDTYLNNYVQPAPNVAALGKYADIPVSYYTGVPEISVPLYTLTDGSIKIPIALNYHASGIKVSENASWVGLGWSLFPGGVITRTVRGAPDEGTIKTRSFGAGPSGYYASSGMRANNMPQLPFKEENPALQNDFTGDFIPDVVRGALDTEPDLYTFNFNGHIGKFVFDENQTVRLLTDDDIKVKVIPNGGVFSSWIITTPDGMQYYFGEHDSREINYVNSTTTNTDQDAMAPSTWYLTRMINPNTKDTATFSYTQENYTYHDLGPETSIYLYDATDLTGESHVCDLTNIGALNLLTTEVAGLRLTGITTKHFQVKFIAQNQRQDLINQLYYSMPTTFVAGDTPGPAPHYACSLDSIKIFSGNNCIKQFGFNYDYFISPTTTSARVTTGLYSFYGHGDSTDTKRLKLTSLVEFSGDRSERKPPYVFTYNETQHLPRRLSYDQDHWGFCNNSAGNHNNYFTPSVGQCTVSPASSNRAAKWPEMSALTLTQMQDPMGTTTTFSYEGNNTQYNLDSTLVGGLRIHEIDVAGFTTAKTNVRKFDYGPGGILYRFPDNYYYISIFNEYFHQGTGGTGGYDGYHSTSYVPDIIRSSQSIVPLQDPQGNVISYPFVKEIFGPNAENGYKNHRYSVNLSPNSSDSRIYMGIYTKTDTIDNVIGTYGNGKFNDTLPGPRDYASGRGLYPITPEQIDITRGHLIGEATYDAVNNLLDSVRNVYSETLHENYWIRGFMANRVVHHNVNVYINMDALAYYKLHTGISHLDSTIHMSFRNRQRVTEVSSYGYESTHHIQPTSDTTINSNGDVTITKTYYSLDYGATDPVFNKMVARNLLLPVSVQTWKNNKLIKGKVTVFKDFAAIPGDTIINPVKIYSLETPAPMTAVQAGQSLTWSDQTTWIPGNGFKARANLSFDSYSGKPLNEQLKDGPNISYQWGYNNTYPVARVQNAANTITTSTSPSSGGGSVTVPQGSTQTYSTSFLITGSGNTSVELGFSGNPGTNPAVKVEAILSGPNGFYQNSPLCIARGTGNCGGYLSEQVFTDLAPGTYTLSAYNYDSINQNCDMIVSAFAPSQTTTTIGGKEFYYEGYEDSTAPGVVTGTGHTGVRYYSGTTDTVHWTKPNVRNYVITYWYLSGGKWLYQNEQVYSGPTFTLTGGTAYDDIRIYPIDALMTTYTYDPAVGMTSSTDPKGLTTYYEYDSFQRLMNVRDKDGNIVKSYKYNYQQPK